MPDYSKGKIYAIRAPGTDSVYIGSTTQALSMRLAEHRSEAKRGRPCTSTEMLKFPGHYIELIENCPCTSKEELNRREGEVIRATPSAVNKVVAGRTKVEHYQEHKDIYKERTAQYHQEHKSEILNRKAEYYQELKGFLNPLKSLRLQLKKGLPLFIDEFPDSNPELQEGEVACS